MGKRSGYAPNWMSKQYDALRARKWNTQIATHVDDGNTATVLQNAKHTCQASRDYKEHSKKTKFVYPSLKLHCFDPSTGNANGIIAISKIRFGTILAVDYPILMVNDEVRFGEAVRTSIAGTEALMYEIVRERMNDDLEF